MAYAHIAHDCIIGNNCIIVNSVALGGHVTIGDFAIIGGGSLVHQFTKIGCHSMIAGGSIIRKDIPPLITSTHVSQAMMMLFLSIEVQNIWQHYRTVLYYI